MNAFIPLIAAPASVLLIVGSITNMITVIKWVSSRLIDEGEGCLFVVDETGCLRKTLVEYDRF